MPRTKMLAAASTGGELDSRLLHFIALSDHAEGHFNRICLAEPENRIPSEFRRDLPFCFQVYSTVSSDLDDERTSRGSSLTSNLKSLTHYLFGSDLLSDSAQCPPPIVDIYDTVFPDVLACVEHQRLEIQHRKSRHLSDDVLLIPKLIRASWDKRKRGFILVVTPESLAASSEGSHYGGNTMNRPRWVWFDRCLPAASRVTSEERHDVDQTTRRIGLDANESTQELPAPPEKAEILSEVHQDEPDTMQRQLGTMYSLSYFPQQTPAMEWGLEQDELGERLSTDVVLQTAGTSFAASFTITDSGDGIRVASKGMVDSKPTLAYAVCVQFCPPGDLGLLRTTAQSFTVALTGRLDANATVALQFYPSQTLTESMRAAKQLNATHPSFKVGALTSSTALAHRARSGGKYPERIYPIDKQEALTYNDPITSHSQPHQTFVVIIDRPDFVDGPGVLFLLADGGQRRPVPNLPASYTAKANYVDLEVWRSASMDEVARRLSMDYPEFI